MTADDRRAMIDDIVSSSPGGLGLAQAARRNAESLGDGELLALRESLMAVRSHSAGIRAEMRIDTSAAEASLVARRKELYARLKSLGGDGAASEGRESSAGSPVGRGAVDASAVVTQEDALLVSMNFWDRLESHPKDELTDRLLEVVSAWMLRLERLAFGQAFPRSLVAPILEDDSLRGELQAYCELALDKLGRDTLRILRNHVVHGRPAGLEAGIEGRMMAWLLTDKAISNPLLEFAFYNATRGKIPYVRAMEGLAKVRLLARDYGADTIVSMHGGGEMVGDFLAHRPRGGVPKRVVMRRHGSGFHFAGDGRKVVLGAKRILLVDDVLNRGGVLMRAHSQIADLAKSASIQIVALVGTAEARNGLVYEHRSAFVPTVTVDDATDVPWGRDGTYVFEKGKHIFGAGSSRPWSVASWELRQIDEDLATSL